MCISVHLYVKSFLVDYVCMSVTYVCDVCVCIVCVGFVMKVGDDLRQDALILQLLRVMSELWRREGLDMQMMLYDCISTGFERGLLQVSDRFFSKRHFSLCVLFFLQVYFFLQLNF